MRISVDNTRITGRGKEGERVTTYFISQIHWIPHEKGGRKKIPPKGTRYCPLIRIYDKIGYQEWSLDFVCPDFEETDMIKIKFLVDDAPCELIEKNMTYNLYEGNRNVAKIKVVECYNE